MTEESENTKQVRARARDYGLPAIEVLAEVMNQGDSAATARVTAAKALLERGYGRVGLAPAEDEERETVLVGFERVIIDPRCKDLEQESQPKECEDRNGKKARLDS
jgi:hypothetical protein